MASTPKNAALTAKRLQSLQKEFASVPRNMLMQNAVTQTTVTDIALNRAVVAGTDHSFSTQLDSWSVTNQKQSGRCWLFAALNMLRPAAMKKMNLVNFEFSQNHALFWDKIERANFFLENIIDCADQDVGAREVAFLLADPIGDGGQWNMFVNVVKKHGVVPKSAMPETQSSSSTRAMNRAIVAVLREGAKTLRDLHAAGKTNALLRQKKLDIHETVYRILCIHLGTPPSKFDWQWKDKDKKFHRDGSMTPKQFAKKYLLRDLDDFACLVHDPRNPFNKTYTVKYLGNVVGGAPVTYLNIDIDLMKKITMRTLKSGDPVWMGCDVGKQMRGDLGIWDANLYDYQGVYGTSEGLSKTDRLLYGATQMTHAMLFTGVDVVDGSTRRWRVENSWGDAKGRGQKGFYTMNDSWFDAYMFEVAAPKKFLPAKLRKALATTPTILPPWDPMGSLA